ncbi:hypothetical protein IFR04_005697 [Cadophora malorum]|uniref:Uncharacterized protein n=1 Tax=Cadophora malorum TaxID=108018 RepID=A0A8H7TKE2_9HELO|nr:hypothetical protein IFR04_005697 [Cadophora malorum]
MGKHGVPQIPMYFYQAVEDEVMPISGNDALIDSYCSKSISSLQYIRHKAGNHAATSFAGAGGAVGFLKDRFNGVPAQKGCNRSNWWRHGEQDGDKEEKSDGSEKDVGLEFDIKDLTKGW